MGRSDDDRKKKKSRKEKEKKKKRDRTPSSDSQSSSRDSPQTPRHKKIKKRSTSTKNQAHKMLPLPPSSFLFNPYGAPPPPPTSAPPSAVPPRSNKATKQSNIFKLLPVLSWAPIMFSNTLIDPDLLGQQNYQLIITRMWKTFDRKTRGIILPGIQKVTKKLIPDGIANHQKLVAKLKQKSTDMVVQSTPFKYSDFDILKAYHQKKPIQEIQKMIGPQNSVKLS